MRTLIGLAYLVIGIIVAATHNYFDHLGSAKGIGAAVLAILLWPLVLFGVNLHLGTGKKGSKEGLFLPLFGAALGRLLRMRGPARSA